LQRLQRLQRKLQQYHYQQHNQPEQPAATPAECHLVNAFPDVVDGLHETETLETAETDTEIEVVAGDDVTDAGEHCQSIASDDPN
jgi:hypothetical protein